MVIYNALGQEVRVLASRQMAAGLHTLQWDGKNESGEGVASGIYLYRLETGIFSQARKMILVR